jgi:hypothetical protein
MNRSAACEPQQPADVQSILAATGRRAMPAQLVGLALAFHTGGLIVDGRKLVGAFWLGPR